MPLVRDLIGGKKVLIRNAQERDFTSCVEVAKRSWPIFEREAVYHLFCKFFNDTCFVCEHDETLDGFLLGFISQTNRAEAYIHWIVVDPSAQRRGVATRLYERFFEAARRFGAQRVRLTVDPANAASLALQKRNRFQPDLCGETILVGDVLAVRDYNGKGLHMVPFLRSLT